MGPAKSPFWGLNYITIKFIRYTKQHIVAMVPPKFVHLFLHHFPVWKLILALYVFSMP